MSFPLYRRPGGIFFLDDDPSYLEMLAQVMPQKWYVRLFLQSETCINTLQQEPPGWEADAWAQKEMVQLWHEGAPLIPQILQYWRDDDMARFHLTQVCVVDYTMPKMNGLRVLTELGNWSGSRVLLTGRTDEQLAISAFDRGLIEQFIPKQSPDIRSQLTEAIENLQKLPNDRHQEIWRATLSREQMTMISIPSVARDLQALSLKNDWVEHVLIGEPFGILALDRSANASWLQLEPEKNLLELGKTALSQGMDEATAQEIAAGKKLTNSKLNRALGDDRAPQACSTFPMEAEQGPLYGAVFSVPTEFSPGYGNSFQHFIDSREARKIER